MGQESKPAEQRAVSHPQSSKSDGHRRGDFDFQRCTHPGKRVIEARPDRDDSSGFNLSNRTQKEVINKSNVSGGPLGSVEYVLGTTQVQKSDGASIWGLRSKKDTMCLNAFGWDAAR